METLTPSEACLIAGVPAAQLIRWAWEDWDVYTRKPRGLIGPKSAGTRHKPRWREQDVRAWRARYEAVA